MTKLTVTCFHGPKVFVMADESIVCAVVAKEVVLVEY